MYIISWRSWTLALEYVTITLTLNISSERLVCTYRPSVSIFVDKQRRRCQPCFTTHDNRIRSIVCNWYIKICPCCLTIYNKGSVFQYWTHTSNVTVLSIILLLIKISIIKLNYVVPTSFYLYFEGCDVWSYRLRATHIYYSETPLNQTPSLPLSPVALHLFIPN